MKLKNDINGELLSVYIDVHDNNLSRKWLLALNDILNRNLFLEKNYCFFGFADSPRHAEYIMSQVNNAITAINSANLGYTIDDFYSVDNTIGNGLHEYTPEKEQHFHNRMNMLHRYFEDLQGTSGNMPEFYYNADEHVRWQIRQLNLLCHEYESLVLSMRKKIKAPEWQRPSQLMCWLKAPRFTLDENDYELFGVDSIARPLGGVFVGVNKAIGKHHWEVFNDEGRDSRIDELTTTSMRSQTEAAGDFDIEWANDPGKFPWMQQQLDDFRNWLKTNGFDPEDKSLTIGHPQVGQVDLMTSFGTDKYETIWSLLSEHMNVHSITTSDASATYEYNWSDADFVEKQIIALRS